MSSPDDAAEREARAVAARIVRIEAPGPVAPAGGAGRPISQGDPGVIQRQAQGPAQAPPAVAATISSSGAGRPLSPSVRRFMEPRFRADFSRVRIHSDEQAAVLSRQLDARAFAVGNQIFFGRGEFQPETQAGQELLAHELTHTIQQGAADQVRRNEAVSVTQHSPLQVQRLGIGGILDSLAELAAHLPGFTLLALIIGRNPITLQAVERTAVLALRAFMGLIPGGEMLFQVSSRYEVAQRLGAWVNQQGAALGLTFQNVRDAFTRFTGSLGIRDVVSPGNVWRRAQAIFTPFITRIRSLAGSLAHQAIAWLKEAFLQPLSDFGRQIPGYELVTVLLGRDPFTGAAAPRSALALVTAFARFIPGGAERVNQLVESKALDRARAWLIEETEARSLTWAGVAGALAQAWNSLRLEDMLRPMETLRRMVAIFRPLMGDLVSFARNALMKLLELIFEAVMGAGGARVLAILRRARATFLTIVQNPVGFLRNLLGAIGQGVRQFSANILRHLRDGVIGWLAGPVARAGVQMPERWDMRGVVWFVLQILGLTWTYVRQKLVGLMGERSVAMLEASFRLVQEIRERGLAQALRERVSEFFGQLQEAALGAIRSFIQQRLVMAGVTQLVSMLNPVGAVIQAITKIYTTIQFFIQKINEILDLVEAVVNSIASIASGAIGQAANWIERTMARTIPVILDFLARFIGLGNVGGQVQDTIRGLRARVDQMVDRAVAWIRRQALALASRVLGGDPAAPAAVRVQRGLHEGLAAVNRFAGQRVGEAVLRPLLAAIRLRHRLSRLEVIREDEFWAVLAANTPHVTRRSKVKVPIGAETDWPTGAPNSRIPIKWFKPREGLYPTIRIGINGSDKTYLQGVILPAIGKRPARLLRVATGNLGRKGDVLRRQPRPASEPQKQQIRQHIEALQVLPLGHQDRIFFRGQQNWQSKDWAVDHVWDLTWRGLDADDNLWPLEKSRNDAINATHNQRVRVREDQVWTNAVFMFPNSTFEVAVVVGAPPASKDDHGTNNDDPINSGRRPGIPKKLR